MRPFTTRNSRRRP